MTIHDLIDPHTLVRNFGYLGVATTIFLESGIMFGFFLPGDSLLFTAGLLASQHYLNIFVLILASVVAAVLGNNVGYATGRKLGPTLFSRKDSFLFSHERIEEAHKFFDTQGGKALILARFTPVIRTFVPIIAGVGKMRYRTFFVYNLIGAFLWGIGITLLGYTLGRTVPSIDKYLLPIIAVIVIVSALPAIFSYIKERKRAKSTK